MRKTVRIGVGGVGIAALLAGVLVSVPAAADTRQYVSTADTEWTYLDTGVDPGTEADLFNWTKPDFDASEWATAKGSFGSLRGAHADVGGNSVNTHLRQYYDGTSTNVETFFFRSTFTLEADTLAQLDALVGTVRFDDALAVWVNGEKVAGFLDEDFDPDFGNMQYLGSSNGDPIVRPVTIDPEVLVSGENTIAVALYQDRRDSSDIYFDFETLTADTGPASLAPGQFISSAATTWDYHDFDQDPAGDGDLFSWTEATYNASDWREARAPFGSLRGAHTDVSGYPVHTHLTQYKPGTSTNIEAFFFRTAIDIAADELSDLAMLTGTVVHDDALAVWVNGQKVTGVLDGSFDPTRGNMQYLGASNGSPIRSTVVVPAALLNEGTNQVAVATYQDRHDSSDIYFDFETLEAVSASAPVDVTDVVLNIGANETERNVAWYTTLPAAGEVQWAPASAMSGAAFPEAQATTAAAVEADMSHDGRNYNHATMADLAENSAYVYRVGSERGWSDVFEFTTGEFGADSFEFLMMGDPQLGSSGNLASDEAGWHNTLDVSQEMFPDSHFIHSVGDQVEHAASEPQYQALLSHDRVREVPLSTINGNHDVGSTAYRTHFFMPNLDESYGPASNSSQSGGNHWYLYNNLLVIGLNSNNMDVSTHDAFIEKVLAEQGDKADWHAVSFHHSAFSVANHSTNSRIVQFRNEISPVLSDHGIDFVMMGHDHSYTRTHLMDGRTPVEAADAGELTPEEGQTLYVTGNSSSGSKYYGIRSSDQIANADPNGFNYAQVMWQERVPSFTNVEIDGDTLTVTSYRTDTRQAFDQVVLHRAGAEDEPVDPDPVDPDPVDPDPVDPEPTDPEPTDPEPTDPEPVNPEPTEPSENELSPALKDLISVDGDLVRGQSVTVTAGTQYAAQSVSGYLFSEPLALGTAVVTAGGAATLQVPADAPLGEHSLALYSAQGELLGWTEVSVVADSSGSPSVDASDNAGADGLSVTGFDNWGLAGLALALLVLGGMAALVARSRQARVRTVAAL